jgi:aminoglycoside phosphotransferase (APT) family kinase protein
VVTHAHPDWRTVRAWPLAGGVSAQVHAIEVRQPDGRLGRLVLRQYGAASVRADPHPAVTEYRLLRKLHEARLPVPWPHCADESGAIVPSPWLLSDYVAGEAGTDPDFLATVAQPLAEVLADLHETGLRHADVPFLPDATAIVAGRLAAPSRAPDEALSEPAIRAALAVAWPPRAVNQPVVLHGDYWPGNVLWRAGRVAAVVDWEDAMFGDPLADLSVARLELSWFAGPAVARAFTARYLALRPETDAGALAVWDLWAALRPAGKLAGWGLIPSRLVSMIAAHRQFVSEALGQLTDPRRGS